MLIEQDNEGVAKARNVGLDQANGEYVTFVDVDDYLGEKYLESLYCCAKNEKVDIVCGGYTEIHNEEKRVCNVENNKVDSIEKYYDLFLTLGYTSIAARVVWGKLFRKDLLKKYRFDDRKYGEDTLFMFKIWNDNPVTLFIEENEYYHVKTETSVTININRPEYKEAMLSLYVELINIVGANSERLARKTKEDFEKEMIDEIFGLKKIHNDKQAYYECKEVIVKYIKYLRKLGISKTKNKIIFLLYQYCSVVLWMII